ncbi:MAG: YheU family protein [Desulfuromonadales bacterium]|nr:YheU family protein [Desulfuromonadales bacterium]
MSDRDETQTIQQSDSHEEAVEIPLERINPDTLRKMLEEFVTREWSELADSGYTLDEKVEQVLQQLNQKRARIVYDSSTETWNIVPCR